MSWLELQTKVRKDFTIMKTLCYMGPSLMTFGWVNVKESYRIVSALNQEKALLGVFSVIVKSSQTFDTLKL